MHHVLTAQDTLRYVGTTLSNVDYHHGQLPLAVGVHNIQTMRAWRSDTGAIAWTYNHAPMLAWWKGKFYLEYLSNPVGEHQGAGRTLLQTSNDGYQWSYPKVIFPPYRVSDGYVKPGKSDTAKNAFAVMHQRMGFYVSKSNRLFALAFYGIVLAPKDDPNDGNGIGRVIREIMEDGSCGPIYFLRFNHGFGAHNTAYPFYKSSSDKGLVAACEEILNNPLLMMQTVEEADRNDPLIPLQKDYKAFNYYRLPNGHVVGLWKYALTSISKNEGRNWQYTPTRAPGFVNANAKIWGQKTSDGRYATLYNPSEFRWPLAVSVSNDGLNYHNLLLVNGEITSMRYGGAYKSYGPQYVRGIQEMNGTPPDGQIWVTYSMNKEDMWVSRIPVPILDKVDQPVLDNFATMPAGHELDNWNIFSPLWCQVTMQQSPAGKVLALHDADPFDHAKAERLFPASVQVKIDIILSAQQNSHGLLEIELQDRSGLPCLRLVLDSMGNILTRQGYRYKNLGAYKPGQLLELSIELNTATRFYQVSINGQKLSSNICFQPVQFVERLVFRTGSIRRFPNADTPTDQDYDLPDTEAINKQAVFHIYKVQTSNHHFLPK